MAYWNRYGRRYRRYRKYRRFYRRFRRYGYARRYVNASSKSSVRVKVPVSTVVDVSVNPAGTVYSQCVCPFVSSANNTSALTSLLYRNYTNLYDEVKCVGVKVVISIGTPIGSVTIPSLTVVTGWDRNHGSADAVPTYADLTTYGSQQKAVAVNNSIAKLIRTCYMGDLIEKASWHDCTLADSGANKIDSAYSAAAANPNFFAPALWIGMSHTGDSAQTVKLLIDVTYYFAFRNPKYGGSSIAKGIDVLTNSSVMANLDDDDNEDEDMVHDEDSRMPDHDVSVPVQPKKKKVRVVPAQKN